MLTLVFPHISHKLEYLDMIAEWKSVENQLIPSALTRGENYEEFLFIAEQDLTENNLGVPATLFFLMDGDHIFGAIQIRHHIDHPGLRDYG